MPFNSQHRRLLAAGAVLAIISFLAHANSNDLDDASAGDPYPLPNCVIRDEPLEKRCQAIDFMGRDIRVCCNECVDQFKKEHHTWIRELDDRLTRQQRDFYPLDTCAVDGQPLVTGLVLELVFRNRLFRLCSLECQRKLEQEPARSFARLNAAVVTKQKPACLLDACIVTGEPLGKAAVDYVIANQLVRLARAEVAEQFKRTPGKYLAKLRELAKQKSSPKP